MISLRCSSLDRVLACPGSLLLCSMVAPRRGDEAEEGTALHALSALRIVAELGASAPEGLPPHDPEGPTLRFSKWVADYYVRHVAETAPAGWAMEVEAAFAYEFHRFTLSGHLDCFAISPDATEAIAWDLKTGRDPVDPADENWQFAGYIALLKCAFPSLRKITFYGVQPWNDEDDGFERVSSVTIEGAKLEAICDTLAAEVGRAIDNSRALETGRKQCNYCDAATQCPALQAERDLMKLQLTDAHLEKIRTEPEDTTLADWLLSVQALTRPMKDVKEIAKERIAITGHIASSSGVIIGTKTSAGTYEITDREGLWQTAHGLLPAPKLVNCSRWSMTDLKDAIAEHMGVAKSGRGSVTAQTIFDDKIRPHVKQGEKVMFTYK